MCLLSSAVGPAIYNCRRGAGVLDAENTYNPTMVANESTVWMEEGAGDMDTETQRGEMPRPLAYEQIGNCAGQLVRSRKTLRAVSSEQSTRPLRGKEVSSAVFELSTK